MRTGERTIEARRIVNAAGAAAADIAAMLGITIALQGVPLQVTVTEPVAPLIPHLVYSAAGKLSLKQAHNGSCLIGGGWHARRLADGRLVTNPAHLAGNMTNAANLVPTLRAGPGGSKLDSDCQWNGRLETNHWRGARP